MAVWKNLCAVGAAAVLAAAAAGAAVLAGRANKRSITREWAEKDGEFPDEFVTPRQAQERFGEQTPVCPHFEDRGPNANPVEAAPVEPRQENAPLDPTKIACAEDFQDWDDLGCRS